MVKSRTMHDTDFKITTIPASQPLVRAMDQVTSVCPGTIVCPGIYRGAKLLMCSYILLSKLLYIIAFPCSLFSAYDKCVSEKERESLLAAIKCGKSVR